MIDEIPNVTVDSIKPNVNAERPFRLYCHIDMSKFELIQFLEQLDIEFEVGGEE